MFQQTDTIVIKVHLCDASFKRSYIVVMQLDSRPTSSPCRWLNMQKNFWQNWSCLICGSDCSFVGHHVDNNRPLSNEENGEHSLFWTETCFQDLRAWFIFGQPHHVRTFILHSEEGNATLVTRNNIRKPLRAIWLKFLQPTATNCHPLFFLLCCQLVEDPFCAPLGPTKLLMDDSMCTSVAYTKLQS